MHDDTCRFVDDEQVLVLVGDAEPDLLRFKRLRFGERLELDFLAPG